MIKNIINQFNIPGQCRRYGLSLWQCPQFLFVVMGSIIVLTTIISYLIGAHYIANPEIVALVVLIITGFLFIIAFTITRSFEKLAETSKLKSEFINIVSHQLRSPLTNIKWTFEVLASEEFEVSKSKQDEYFINVKENIARMVELIDDLLIVSKLEEGVLTLARAELDLEDLIKRMISQYDIFAKASDIKLSFQSDNSSKALADSSMIKLVIENLIDNAIRYTKGGGAIDIKIKKQKDCLLCSIKDQGVGIPEKEQKHIFQKFFRAGNALKQRTKGSGLGLYVCKLIINKSGGKIWFESKENKGTTFFFTLPIIKKLIKKI